MWGASTGEAVLYGPLDYTEKGVKVSKQCRELIQKEIF